MTWWEAIILGVVEGLTEYLPISSTGHLLVTQQILGIGTPEAGSDPERAKEAADAFAICVQAGAILAVLFLYAGRCRSMVDGAMGKSEDGRRILINIIAAFVPAAIIGLTFNRLIKEALFNAEAVVAAWFVGGVAILITAWWQARSVSRDDVLTQGVESEAGEIERERGIELEQMTWKMALVVGVAQCIAMWPGVSRSLVTIVGGVLIGLKLRAAVEFSFLLGVVTLGAATAYDALKHGDLMLEMYGPLPLLLGSIAAFISALLAVKWMVSYLKKHGLAIFGWYRIAIAIAVGFWLLSQSPDPQGSTAP